MAAERLVRLGQTAACRLYGRDGRLLYVGTGSDPTSRWRDRVPLAVLEAAEAAEPRAKSAD